jgi:hypothetical protein
MSCPKFEYTGSQVHRFTCSQVWCLAFGVYLEGTHLVCTSSQVHWFTCSQVWCLVFISKGRIWCVQVHKFTCSQVWCLAFGVYLEGRIWCAQVHKFTGSHVRRFGILCLAFISKGPLGAHRFTGSLVYPEGTPLVRHSSYVCKFKVEVRDTWR